MSIVQPKSVVQFEIWLYAKPSFRLHVAECGAFATEAEACRVGALVRQWLQLGVFGPELRAAIKHRKRLLRDGVFIKEADL